MSTEIRTDEWLAELSRLYEDKPVEEAMTLREICNAAGKRPDWATKMLRRAIEAGIWESVRVPRSAIDGTLRPVPAYRPKRRQV